MTRSNSYSVRGGLFLVLLALLVGACSSAKSSSEASTTTTPASTEFTGYVRSPALDVSSVTLPTVDGTPVNMVAKPGGLLIAYFGYTSCPDICPTSLASIKKAIAKQSAADQKRIQFAMITVDPSVDTAKNFAAYLKDFFPTGYAIRTDDPALLRSAAKVFGAEFRIQRTLEGTREVSHSADTYVIDDTGTVILAWSFGVTSDEMERDLARLLRGDRPVTEGS